MDAGLWRPFRGGDGGFVAVDPASDATIYGEYVYLSIHRSVNGQPGVYICNGITEALASDEGGNQYCGANATKQANFIAPFILDPNNCEPHARRRELAVGERQREGRLALLAHDQAALHRRRENYINAIAVHEGNSNVI